MIGGNMIRESLQEDDEEEDQEDRLDYKELFLLAIATSIDALAVGITFAFLQVEIISSVLLIGAITFVISFVGVIIGNVFGNRFKSKAEIIGGIILILIGIKILLEHLNILS
jgi:putative Mn2+ efflux pump MntP